MSALKLSKTKSQTKVLEPMIYVVFWLLLFASPLILGYQQSGTLNWIQVFQVWKSFLPYLLIFLLNRYVLLPYLFFRNRRWWFAGINLLVIVLFAFFVQPEFRVPGPRNRGMESRPGKQRHTPPVFRPENDQFRPGIQGRDTGGTPGQPGPPPRRGMPYYLSFILISILMVGFETGTTLSFKWIQSERDRIKIAQENVSNKLAFLRSQVSPHFFMNTLNNIHSLVDLDTTKAKNALIQFSGLMRHMLYDSEIEKIPIEKEFAFVKNYVDLMRLRFGENVDIQVKMPEESLKFEIPPMIFTSFIENAFKYGISSVAPSFVHLSFEIHAGFLVFDCTNSVFDRSKTTESTGIGIQNVKRRLELIYRKSHFLRIDDLDNIFKVHLKLPL